MVSEQELIDYIKPRLKKMGFTKKNKKWSKIVNCFTCVFLIQGSIYDKETYYIRPSVYINDCPTSLKRYYGQFMCEIEQTSPEQILEDTERFFEKWTNKEWVKKTVNDFMKWEKRNPVEKRHMKETDEENDPVNEPILFQLGEFEIQWIIDNL